MRVIDRLLGRRSLPADRELLVSVLEREGADPKLTSTTWAAFVARLRAQHAAPLPPPEQREWWSPAEWYSQSGWVGATHRVRHMHLAALRFEGITSFQVALVQAQLYGIDAVLYSTPRNGDLGLWWVTAAIRLEHPHTTAEWEDVWQRLYRRFDSCSVKADRTPGQAYLGAYDEPKAEWPTVFETFTGYAFSHASGTWRDLEL